jgi:hypothetical protein
MEKIMHNSSAEPLNNTSSVIRMTLFVIAIYYCIFSAINVSGLNDYIIYIFEVARDDLNKFKTWFQFAFNISIYLLSESLLFCLLFGCQFREPKSQGSDTQKILGSILRILILISPAFFLSGLITPLIIYAEVNSIILFISAAILTISVIILSLLGVIAVSSRLKASRGLTRVHVLGSFLVEQFAIITKITMCMIAVFFSALLIDPFFSMQIAGGIGVITVFIATLTLATLALSVNANARLYALASLAFIAFLAHVIPIGSVREFRHSRLPILNPNAGKIDEVFLGDENGIGEQLRSALKQRHVPILNEAFVKWLKARPSFETFVSAKRKYPVFLVAAQGGGQYAAYHTALFMARLYDACPDLQHHIFAVSSVSGGSLGSVLLAELLKTTQPQPSGCRIKEATGKSRLEDKVRSFFEADLVSPVIANLLYLDFPRLLIPQLPMPRDRAGALELAIEQTWRRKTQVSSGGLDTGFIGAWSAEGPAPALFMNTTAANFGLPVLLSQVFMSSRSTDDGLKVLVQNFSLSAIFLQIPLFKDTIFYQKSKNLNIQEHNEKIIRLFNQEIYGKPKFYNILEFAPDLQINKSTAAVLSARFPYITPSGTLLTKNNYKPRDIFLRNANTLQLIDGGFWDNSGIGTALEIARNIKDLTKADNILDNIDFYLISFGHANNVLQNTAPAPMISESIAPIATFEAIRQAKRVRPSEVEKNIFKKIYSIELFDHSFEAPLTWTLSAKIRKLIEERSGGDVEESTCCGIVVPSIFPRKDYFVNADPMDREYFQNGLKLIAPNKTKFEEILSIVTQ